MLLSFLLVGYTVSGQTKSLASFKPDPEKEKQFLPYLAVHHGGLTAIEEWKKANPEQYKKEIWYYTESFRVKRDHSSEGVSLDASIIDISRFESQRQANKETIVVMPGFKDALVLLPASQLLYQPNSK